MRIKGEKNESDVTVGVYYRPPSQPEEWDDAFCEQTPTQSKGRDVVLMGDFNYPDICWQSNSAKNARSNKFLTALADNFMVQKVEEATRGKTILDLVITNKEDLVNGVEVVGTLGKSDHALLEFVIQLEGEAKHSQTRILDFKKANFCKLRELLAVIPWTETLKKKGVQDGWEFLKTEILKAQFKTVPTRRKNGRGLKKPQWFTKELSTQLTIKKNKYKEWKNGKCTKEEYKQTANICRGMVKKLKRKTNLN